MRSTTPALDRPAVEARATRGHGSLVAGLVVVAGIPALFWAFLLQMIGTAVGYPFSGTTVVMVGGIIFALLGCVWASFVLAGGSRAG
jgi:hypothetical protein